MKKSLLFIFGILIVLSSCFLIGCSVNETQCVFYVTCDMRQYTGDNPDHFRAVCEKIASLGKGEFMVSAGDIDPPGDVLSTIQTYIGKNYSWYPVVGNHEIESTDYMAWLRSYNENGNSLPNVVNIGPTGSEETIYSFDYGDVHYVVLNEYYDGVSDSGADGDVVDALYDWLIDDLEMNDKPIIVVFGHEPAYPQPDEESGRIRHENDSLNAHPENRDRFWNALVDYGVLAYICGHTHNYSIICVDGVWQIDSGHARGTADTGSRSTFVSVSIMVDRDVFYKTYRLDLETGEYVLTQSGQLG